MDQKRARNMSGKVFIVVICFTFKRKEATTGYDAASSSRAIFFERKGILQLSLAATCWDF
jgi:hypothetical protein